MVFGYYQWNESILLIIFCGLFPIYFGRVIKKCRLYNKIKVINRYATFQKGKTSLQNIKDPRDVIHT